MAIHSRPIPSLLNGVSQQPSSLRHPSQCELQINGYASLADGLKKRNPAQHIDKVSTAALSNAFTHVINWGVGLQWLVVVLDTDLKVYAPDGTEETVNFPDGKTYLNVTDPVTEFAVVTVGDTIYIANKSVTVAKTATTAGGTLQGEVQDFGSLPVSGLTDGDVYEIIGDDTLNVNGYYMKWDATNTVWKESPLPGTTIELDKSTMPMKLTYNSGTGQFTLAEETWSQRGAGDTTSLPDPDFVGREIRDLFFHRNRLGVLSGEYMTFSRSGPDYVNFFYQSASTELDTDPINLRAANVNISTLNSAVPYNKQLIAFSDKSQFTLSTAIGQILKGTTAALDTVTSYLANAVARPLAVGGSLYFCSESSLFANMREYITTSDNEINNLADEVTAHIPQYIPAGVFKTVLAEDEDVMFLLTTGDQSRLYVYKYFWLNEEKIQSSWSYWQFDAGDTILNIDVIDDSLFILIERSGDGVHLHRIDLTDDPSLSDLGFTCLLDKRVSLTGVYSAGTGLTTWTLPYAASSLTLQIVKGGSWAGAEGSLIAVNTQPTSTTVTAIGDYSAHPVYIGVPYEFRYRLSEQFLRKSPENDQGSPILHGKLQLQRMFVRYYDTGYFRVEVTPRQGATAYTYTYNGMTLGSASLIIGSPRFGAGIFRFPIMADSKNATIDLINDTHVQCALVSAEWTGNFTSKTGS